LVKVCLTNFMKAIESGAKAALEIDKILSPT
jgi:hypothetical protein